MINGYVRKDRLSEIKLVSGGLVMISLEQLEFLLKDLTGKSYDVFEIFTLIRGFDGDIINMDMMDTMVADCMYTLNTDGTNCKHVTLSPVAEEKETSRMIMEGEQTMLEYYISETKRLKVNISKNLGFVTEKCNEYKKAMIGKKNENR